MRDYVYPSIYFAYFYFFLLLVGALYFFFRSIKHGYWGKDSEEPKYRMLEDDEPPQTEEKTSGKLRRQQ
ncbi:MAG: cbb3-type cytochrome oxidase assembly protein [Blastocatellales bacterium]